MFHQITYQASKKFHDPINIISNKNSINNPKVALTSNNFAIIVWSQNKYTNETLPPNSTINDLINSQEIWGAIYDFNLNKITNVWKINDDNMLGNYNPSITVDKNDIGTVCWSVFNNNNSKIFSKNIFLNGNQWVSSNGLNVSSIQGYNNQVKLRTLNDGEVKAVWINHSNNGEENENKIMSNSFFGNNWKVDSI
ncbi:MAG: hypothetical protein ABSG15_15660, partial [FCB group bacterium]